MANMLVLDDEDPELAAQLLDEVLDIRDITTMLVFGTSQEARRAAALADQLAFRGLLDDGGCSRRVVWIHNADPLIKHERLSHLFEEIFEMADDELPLAAVLDSKDVVCATLAVGRRFNPRILERLFVRGQTT